MNEREKSIERWDSEVPALSAAALTQAYAGTLSAGRSVYVRRGATIVEVFPDGTSRLVKRIEAPTPVPVGTQARLS